jgi:hypothetical protein
MNQRSALKVPESRARREKIRRHRGLNVARLGALFLALTRNLYSRLGLDGKKSTGVYRSTCAAALAEPMPNFFQSSTDAPPIHCLGDAIFPSSWQDDGKIFTSSATTNPKHHDQSVITSIAGHLRAMSTKYSPLVVCFDALVVCFLLACEYS